jgi:hypothetical protein
MAVGRTVVANVSLLQDQFTPLVRDLTRIEANGARTIPDNGPLVSRLNMLEFLARPGHSAEDFERRFNELRLRARAMEAVDGSDLALDVCAYETVMRLIENSKKHWCWEPNDLDFGPDDE